MPGSATAIIAGTKGQEKKQQPVGTREIPAQCKEQVFPQEGSCLEPKEDEGSLSRGIPTSATQPGFERSLPAACFFDKLISKIQH